MAGTARLGTLLVFLILAAAGGVEAQEHTVTDEALRGAVAAEVDSEAADRALLERVLARDEVRRVAEKAGLEVEHAQDATGQLEREELARLASMATDVEDQLAGGQATITITTTAIIIALLVIILILVV